MYISLILLHILMKREIQRFIYRASLII